MKQKITSYLFTFLFILLTALVLSITTILLENFIKNEKTMHIIISILSLLLFLFASIIFGRKIRNHGLLNGLILSLIYLFFVLTISNTEFTILNTTLIGSKMLTIIIGTLMGVNLENN